MSLAIRRANVEDYAVFNRLVRDVHALHVEQAAWQFRMPADGVVWAETDYRALLANPQTIIWLAEWEGQVCGFVHLELREAPDLPIFQPRRCVSIESIGVAVGWQRRGVGRALLDAAATWAEGQAAGELILSVHSFNRSAMAFYRELGFEETLVRMRRSLKRPDLAGE